MCGADMRVCVCEKLRDCMCGFLQILHAYEKAIVRCIPWVAMLPAGSAY